MTNNFDTFRPCELKEKKKIFDELPKLKNENISISMDESSD